MIDGVSSIDKVQLLFRTDWRGERREERGSHKKRREREEGGVRTWTLLNVIC